MNASNQIAALSLGKDSSSDGITADGNLASGFTSGENINIKEDGGVIILAKSSDTMASPVNNLVAGETTMSG